VQPVVLLTIEECDRLAAASAHDLDVGLEVEAAWQLARVSRDQGALPQSVVTAAHDLAQLERRREPCMGLLIPDEVAAVVKTLDQRPRLPRTRDEIRSGMKGGVRYLRTANGWLAGAFNVRHESWIPSEQTFRLRSLGSISPSA